MRTQLKIASTLVFLAGACSSSSGGGGGTKDAASGADMGGMADGGGNAAVLKGPSKSSTIALSDDGTSVVMSNPEADSVTIFNGTDFTIRATVKVGKEPWAVVIAPDNKTAWVANRADATVQKITGIETAAAAAGAAINVGSEPTGIALSPTGKKLFVAEWAEGSVSVIDTTAAAPARGTSVKVRNPRAIAVTNDGDADDADETVVVTEFFGRPVAGKEMQDDGRTGMVRLFKASDLSADGQITFAPRNSTFANNNTVGTIPTSPNLLYAIGVEGSRIFVPGVAASPAGGPNFSTNVFPVIYMGDLSTKMELANDTNAAFGTVNLARKVIDKNATPSASNPRFVMGETVDISFVPNLPVQVSYAVSRAADAVTRIAWDAANSRVETGSSQNTQIDLNVMVGDGPCRLASGIVVKDGTRGFVNCWGTRRLGVLDLQNQVLMTTKKSADAPTGETQAQRLGRLFYFTGRGRWSAAGSNGARGGEGWSSCGSCHPDGLTDNITWNFAAGPRQTTSQDGSFSHGTGAQKQRVFNWTGIFDEHHDFERNTRDVSGGLGALTRATSGTAAECGMLDKETRLELAADPLIAPGAANAGIGGLARPLKSLAEDTGIAGNCRLTDWDDVDEFVKTIRPPRAARFPAGNVATGRMLFEQQGCQKCHGGKGWTVSRLFYAPSGARNMALVTERFTPGLAPIGPWVDNWFYGSDTQFSTQPLIAAPKAGDPGPAEPAAVAPPRVTCSIRNVGSFGVTGDIAATNALELKPSSTGGLRDRAQGRGGYNVPSLYGLSVGAPYLHHGQAATLEALLTDAKWQQHAQAGAANPISAAQVTDLVAFLLSIDASTAEIGVPTGGTGATSHDQCPAN